jgi:carboxyl-terminal processing protease
MNYINSKWTIRYPLFLSVALVVGVYLGMKLQSETGTSSFTVYPQNNKLSSLINYIDEQYVDSISKDSLIEKLIPYLLESLDPHSVYIPASDYAVNNEALQGNFDGIGVQFNIQNDTVIVINTIRGGPSEKIGLKGGDRIVKVDDTLIAGVGIDNDGVFRRLKGPEGTKVKVSVRRSRVTGLVDFTIARGKIPLKSVDVAYLLSAEIGYIKLSKFSKDSYLEFMDAVTKLHSLGAGKLILDLRGNTGGFMEVAVQITDEFLAEGKIIVYTEGRSRPKKISRSTKGGECLNDELIVLIDEGSASASEIVAGAIQDNDRGLIVGRRSFGKGLVQEQIDFPDGSALRLTIARYFTPTGRCIQKPYTAGAEKYYEELYERVTHGELTDADSIQFPDSLKYTTPKGKTVFGGGGIMPDIFVPYDTLGISPLYSKLANKGLLYSFAFDYADKHRKQLSQFSNADEIDKFLMKQNIVNQLLRYASAKGVVPRNNDLALSSELLTIHINALIARNIMDDEGFFPILHRADITLKKAVSLFGEK